MEQKIKISKSDKIKVRYGNQKGEVVKTESTVGSFVRTLRDMSRNEKQPGAYRQTVVSAVLTLNKGAGSSYELAKKGGVTVDDLLGILEEGMREFNKNDQLRIVFDDENGERRKATTSVEKWLSGYKMNNELPGSEPQIPGGKTALFSARIVGRGNGEIAIAGVTTFEELMEFVEENLDEKSDNPIEVKPLDKVEVTIADTHKPLSMTVESFISDFHGAHKEVTSWENLVEKATVNGRDIGSAAEDYFGLSYLTVEGVVAYLEQHIKWEEQRAESLAKVKLGEKKGRIEDMGKNENNTGVKEPSITAILKGYSEVTIKQNGLMISFDSKEDILDAFKALTEALDKADKDALAEEMGFIGEQK